MERLEYLGFTETEVCLLSAMVYSMQRGMLLINPDGFPYEVTDKGQVVLARLAEKLGAVELTETN